MTLTPAFLDELRARTTLSALIGRTVKLTRAGREQRGCCPFHNEKTPSFYVNDEKGFYHCLAGETKVLTRDGRVEIAGLAGQTATILTRGGRWVEARFDAYGEQRLLEIALTRNGVAKRLFATSGHRWFVNDRVAAVTTDRLRAGHALQSVLPPRRVQWGLDPAGVRHGIVFGDGTMTRDVYGSVNLHGDKDAALAIWFPDQEHYPHRRDNGQAYLRIYGGRLFDGMKRLPGPDVSDAYLLGFLAGYLAADGHVAKDGTVILNAANPDHLDAVRDLASRLGIATFGRTTRVRSGFGADPSAIHRLHFVRSTLSEDLFLLPEARARFVASAHRFERLRWVVRSVRETERVETVYCACVPNDHAFALDDDILTGNCFGCSAHGDAIRWMTDQRGLPFMDAVKELAAEAGLDVPAPDPRAAERQERAKGLHEAMQAAADWFTTQLHGLDGADARALLERRGITAATAKTFGFGYAPDTRGKLRTALKEYGDPLLIEAGLLIQVERKEPYDRFRGRLMIPIRDPRGRVIAFGGRVIGEGEPKYLNSPDTPLFDKGRTLYNLDRAAPAARAKARIVVVEGYMDVVALAQAGIAEAVAPLGTALTEAQLERLWRIADTPILCLDGDTAGQKAALRAAHRALPLIIPGKSLSFVTLPQGQDPDDLIRDGGAVALESRITQRTSLDETLWRAEIGSLDDHGPDQRAAFEERWKSLVATIKHPGVRSAYNDAFRQRFFQLFGWKGKNFEAVRDAAREANRQQGRGLEYAFQRAVLLGLMRHPSVIAAKDEELSRLPFSDRYIRSWRKSLLKASHDNPKISASMIEQILSGSDVHPIEKRSYTKDLAFSFYSSTASEDIAIRDLRRVIETMYDEFETRLAVRQAREAFALDMTDANFATQVRCQQDAAEAEKRLADWLELVAEAEAA